MEKDEFDLPLKDNPKVLYVKKGELSESVKALGGDLVKKNYRVLVSENCDNCPMNCLSDRDMNRKDRELLLGPILAHSGIQLIVGYSCKDSSAINGYEKYKFSDDKRFMDFINLSGAAVGHNFKININSTSIRNLLNEFRVQYSYVIEKNLQNRLCPDKDLSASDVNEYLNGQKQLGDRLKSLEARLRA